MKFKTVFLQLFLNLLAGVVITLLVRKYMFYQGIAVDLGAWSVFYTVFGVLYAIIMALFALNVDRFSWICHSVSGTAKSL